MVARADRTIPIDDVVNPGEGDALFLGAGDIARCSEIEGAQATGDLIRALIVKYPEATVFTAGDNAYQRGTAGQFHDCYEPSWGSFNDRTVPSPGNHDYLSPRARPYFDYFDYYRSDPAAKARGYYSFDLKDWHIVSLNSNIDMDAASPQVAWLKADLRESHKQCTLAFWHHPLFSNGDEHGAETGDPGRRTGELWKALEDDHAEVIVNGHDHDYERFAPQDRVQTASSDGIRQFVVGTGGAKTRGFLSPPRWANSEHQELQHGVLVLTLGKSSYKWALLGTDGKALDSGAGECRE
ncbi:MAG TPA: metallophosphoesterase [Thermoanaerobaculia bacterium]|nr:metallophosphoesterase [Thermoanaerobaculia bacterium]